MAEELDESLVRSAQAGDMAAFAALVERHRAALRATAIALLGYTDDAEDAVQDALLTALQRLPELREPSAVVPWLKAAVRNNCRQQLRARKAVPVADPGLLLPPVTSPGEERLEQAATADWIRRGLDGLSAPIREVMMLRYFSGVTQYRQIAALCGISPDTVASRLRDGRRALAQQLRQTAEASFDEAGARAEAWHRESAQIVGSMLDGSFGTVVEDWYHPHALVDVMGLIHGDRSLLLDMLDWTFSADVGVRLHHTMASKDVLLWEADFVNPPSDPEHCPPTMVALFSLEQGRVARMGISYGTHHPG
ncbi:RNA polymerase sigma factor [Kineosporia rhizophila]|uniref:RNA polymerase sigma factor n=1 Tax=Kineosporia rhizophila TaxID=84633 RepID=UPI001E392CB0|nr:RNA polymerase sigma factor [Kineosporia rhizophila]MCE0538160.1 RNA polymerase sigma factor [Kineosporia rhizophila]